MPVESTRVPQHFGMYWRDCVGIEPTEPGTQAPQGFEDPGGHQSPIQPHGIIDRPVSVYTEKKICARMGLGYKDGE